MPNNFSNLQNNQASSRFNLVRLSPSRRINALLLSAGGGIYQCSFTGFPQYIYENGVQLTKVTGTPASGQWSFSGGIVSVYPTNINNEIILQHYIFFTSGKNRVWYEDPENTNTELRDWEPLIIKSPTTRQSIENVLAGKLTISSSGLTIVNNDSSWLTSDDSFYKKPVDVWLCIDSETNIKKVFTGFIERMTHNKRQIVFTIRDPLANLDQPCLINDSTSYAYTKQEDWANVDPSKNGEPIRYIVGRASRYQTIPDSSISLTSAERLDPSTLLEAICTSFSTDITTSNNRQWTLCRSSGFTNFSFIPSAVDNSGIDYTRLTGTSAQIDKMLIGDTFGMQTSGEFGRVVDIDRVNNYLYTTKLATTTLGDTLLDDRAPAIVIEDGENIYYCMAGRDYTTTQQTTDGFNKILTITFVNNFEANFSGMLPLDPSTMRVLYRVKPVVTDAIHGTFLAKLLGSASLVVEPTSVTTVNNALAVNVNFCIPQFDESDYSNIYEYIEKILESTIGFIRLNNDFEVELGLFDVQNATVEITESDYVLDSLTYEQDTKEIVSEIIAYNPHFNASEWVAQTGISEQSEKARYLHGINKTIRFRHVLDDITQNISDHMLLRSNRLLKARIDTITKNLDTILGQQFILDGEAFAVIEIEKSPEKTSLILCDMGDYNGRGN